VEPHVAFAESADRFAIDLDVADEQHVGIGLQDALGTGPQFFGKERILAPAKAAEARGETQLLVFGERLATENEDYMVVPGLADRSDGLVGQVLPEIYSGDLRPARRRQGRDL
jgi:hypothetical protein